MTDNADSPFSGRSLRDVNLQLKGEKVPFANEPKTRMFVQDRKEKMASPLARVTPAQVALPESTRPRTHIRAQFFTGSAGKPELLFNALVLELPVAGQVFNIKDQFYEVQEVTRHMEFVGRDGNIAKEFTPSVLVLPFTRRQ